jgi:diaminohydroxyphosphoribosylaminopyrimidine deaminase/5-amino-6-(5-phosphoribosylamino)uracil reductase
MRRAVDLAKLSVDEPTRATKPPRVGAVLVRDGELLAEGYRGKTGEGDHAEFGLLEKMLRGVDLSGATLYTTLEPCSKRMPPKVPCAERVADRGISTVWIGAFDPDPRIQRFGWAILKSRGVARRDFPADLRSEIAADNAIFIDTFRVGRGDTGEARFDYRLNDGRFLVAETCAGVFETRWTSCSSDCIYAYDAAHRVAHPRGADSFDDVDDPSAYEFTAHALSIKEGELAIFRNSAGYLIVRVDDVRDGGRTDDRWELRISWEARLAHVATG